MLSVTASTADLLPNVLIWNTAAQRDASRRESPKGDGIQ